MDKKLLKEIFGEVGGKIAEPLVDILDAKKYLNEFLVAKKLDLPINQTRNILYKISEHGLVSSTRKKDKKKGWFTYSWKIEELKSLDFLKSVLNRKLNQIHNQIKNREAREFYVCERCHIEFNEENALLHDFMCPECGSVLTLKDNTKLIKELKKNLDVYEDAMKSVDEEISKGQAVEAKKIRLKEAAEKREKARKKAAAKAAAAKERAKASKTSPKISKKSGNKTSAKSTKKSPAKKTSRKNAAKKTSSKKLESKTTKKTTKASKSRIGKKAKK